MNLGGWVVKLADHKPDNIDVGSRHSIHVK
jgi:hypothetical protein